MLETLRIRFAKPQKKRTFIAFLIVVSAIPAFSIIQAITPKHFADASAIYMAFALGTGFLYAVRTRCPHCHRRFAEKYFFARMVVLLWAADDKCPFCGKDV